MADSSPFLLLHNDQTFIMLQRLKTLPVLLQQVPCKPQTLTDYICPSNYEEVTMSPRTEKLDFPGFPACYHWARYCPFPWWATSTTLRPSRRYPSTFVYTQAWCCPGRLGLSNYFPRRLITAKYFLTGAMWLIPHVLRASKQLNAKKTRVPMATFSQTHS